GEQADRGDEIGNGVAHEGRVVPGKDGGQMGGPIEQGLRIVCRGQGLQQPRLVSECAAKDRADRLFDGGGGKADRWRGLIVCRSVSRAAVIAVALAVLDGIGGNQALAVTGLDQAGEQSRVSRAGRAMMDMAVARQARLNLGPEILRYDRVMLTVMDNLFVA